jgi:hypothetical protein
MIYNQPLLPPTRRMLQILPQARIYEAVVSYPEPEAVRSVREKFSKTCGEEIDECNLVKRGDIMQKVRVC